MSCKHLIQWVKLSVMIWAIELHCLFSGKQNGTFQSRMNRTGYLLLLPVHVDTHTLSVPSCMTSSWLILLSTNPLIITRFAYFTLPLSVWLDWLLLTIFGYICDTAKDWIWHLWSVPAVIECCVCVCCMFCGQCVPSVNCNHAAFFHCWIIWVRCFIIWNYRKLHTVCSSVWRCVILAEIIQICRWGFAITMLGTRKTWFWMVMCCLFNKSIYFKKIKLFD